MAAGAERTLVSLIHDIKGTLNQQVVDLTQDSHC
jgi:hypothetical protein